MPAYFLQESVAVAGWPSGLLSNTIGGAHVPLHRSESILFQDTAAGIGAQLLVSPVFVAAGPRLSFAPIDVLDVNLKAHRLLYWRDRFGLLAMDTLAGTLESEREGESLASGGWVLAAEPTLKARIGPLVLVDAWTFEWFHLEEPGTSPYVYEPLRDLVLTGTDTVIEQQAIVLWEARGDPAPIRAGATLIDRFSLESEDRTMRLGAMITALPVDHPACPTLVGLVLPYLIDMDREGGVPFLALQARWRWETE